MLEGFLPALAGLTLFFAVLAGGLVRWGIGTSFALALGTALATQIVLLWIKPSRE
jgi:hypothetical protein